MTEIAKPIRRHQQDLVCTELQWSPGTSYDDPRLRVWMLYATVDGQGRIRCGRQTDVLTRPGDLHLLQPGIGKQVWAEAPGWHLYGCHFPGWPRWKQWLQWPRLERGVMHLHLDAGPARERVHACLAAAAAALLSGDPLSIPFAANHLERALLHCQALLPAQDRRLDPRVRRAIMFIEAHPDQRLSNQGIAANVGCSPQHLCALFREQLGMTPLQYQEERRMVQGMQLLRSTPLTVQAVAERLGFSDPFYFSRRFRRRTGCSPQEYRRRRGK